MQGSIPIPNYKQFLGTSLFALFRGNGRDTNVLFGYLCLDLSSYSIQDVISLLQKVLDVSGYLS